MGRAQLPLDIICSDEIGSSMAETYSATKVMEKDPARADPLDDYKGVGDSATSTTQAS